MTIYVGDMIITKDDLGR